MKSILMSNCRDICINKYFVKINSKREHIKQKKSIIKTSFEFPNRKIVLYRLRYQ